MKFLSKLKAAHKAATESTIEESRAVARPVDKSLDAVLHELQQYGCPRVMFFRFGGTAGWLCAVELTVEGKGWTCEVRSDTNHALPIDAAYECLDRVNAKLRETGPA